MEFLSLKQMQGDIFLYNDLQSAEARRSFSLAANDVGGILPEKLSKPLETAPPPPRRGLPELATLLMLCFPLSLVLRHHHQHHNASPNCSSLG